MMLDLLMHSFWVNSTIIAAKSFDLANTELFTTAYSGTAKRLVISLFDLGNEARRFEPKEH